MNIGIIGLGYVGLTFAIAAADHEINVYGVEINQHIKDCLKENRAHFYEPGLDNLIRRHNGSTFHVVDAFSGDIAYDAFIITVGTPLKDGEKKPNFDYIRSSLEAIKNVYNGDQLIVLRSTVSVGTTRNVVIPYLSELCGRTEDEILVAMCPERTLEGTAIKELTSLPQLISGNNERSLEIAQRLFRHITPYVIETDSLEEAELAKLYCNTYRDMTFSLGNAFCMAAQNFGVDGIKVIQHANQGYSRSNIAYPGFVAGPCLEKDAYILINNMPECDAKKFILSARKYNESLYDIVVSWVEEKVGTPTAGKVVALSGMAFKGRPETSDIRGSSSVYIAQKLKDKGYELILHDFAAIKDEMKALNLGDVVDDFYDLCEKSDTLLILNNHAKYEKILGEEIIARNGSIRIFDSWNACTELAYCKELDVYTLGNILYK